MWKLPFISRAAHDEIVASHKAQLALAECQYQARLEEMAERVKAAEQARQKSDDRLIELATAKPEAPQPQEKRRPIRRPPQDGMDLSMVDENDTQQLLYILRREMPVGARVSGVQLQQSIEKLRQQVRMAKRAKLDDLRTNPVKEIVSDLVQTVPSNSIEAEQFLDRIEDEAREAAHKQVIGG